ncbi:MAG: hypothetical protein Cons2KO_34040 [Congregibacter sp.]
MSTLSLRKTLFIKAPAAHVWKFLTEKEKLAIWFHEGKDDLMPDGPYAVVTNSLGKEGDKLCWGRVLEFDPPSRLVHTFTHTGLQGVETTCEWTLVDVEGGSILTLEHSGFEKIDAGFKQGADHDIGWDEHFVRLRKVAG